MQNKDYPNSIVLRGRVRSGVGNFGFWIKELAAYYQQKSGVQLYPGTLNVEVDEPYVLPRDAVRLEASEYGGSVSVSLVPCTINGKQAFVLRTDSNEQGVGLHPRTIIEIASDVRLRDLFDLHDGDLVELRLPVTASN